jgi:DNA-binding transcriptional regulator LsrR (DeoR family)
MNIKRRKIGLLKYLKSHTQQEVADALGCSQAWISRVTKTDPESKLVLIDGQIQELLYSVPKKKQRGE